MCLAGCTPSPPQSTSNTEPVQPCMVCTSARISRPRGSADSSSNPTNSWSGSAPFHFDFQGVISGCPGAYSLTISGTVEPSCFTHGWSLDAAAGTLSSMTAASPTHTSPASAGEGILRLVAMNGSTAFMCRDKKKLKIYQDHLARDRENFSIGISCKDTWSFTRFGATVSMGSIWNCFGSVDHHYNGSGTGYTPSVNIPSGWATTTYDAPITAAQWSTIASALRRGDVVSFWSGSAATGFAAQHAHTCISGTTMYGANNEPVIQPTGHPATWRWFETTSETYFNNVNANPRTAGLLSRVKVHKKP